MNARACATLLAVAAFALPSLALPARADEGWRFQITPYAWVPAVKTSLKPASWAPTIHTKMTGRDVLKDLNGAFFLTGTARYKRLVLLADFTWASLSDKGSVTLPHNLHIGAEAKLTQMSFTLSAGYTVIHRPTWLTVDLLAGVRVWRIRGELDVNFFGLVDYDVGTTKWWADPIIGVRARVYLARRWTIVAYADGGGFGAGSDSTWQVVGTLNFRALEKLYISVGYRHMSARYRDGGIRLDFDMSGPLIGFTWRF